MTVATATADLTTHITALRVAEDPDAFAEFIETLSEWAQIHRQAYVTLSLGGDTTREDTKIAEMEARMSTLAGE